MTNKEEKGLTIKGNYDIAKPDQMARMASVLKAHIVKHKLYTTIAGKNYAHVEGWQFAGGLMGLLPRVVAVENLSSGTEFKWKAQVEIINAKTGQVVGTGFAVCSNKENKKKSFDEYAVLSMAQTRAIGKAYRNIVGWVMKLAGQEGTPAEEMTKVGETAPAAGPAAEPVKTETGFTCSECNKPITRQEAEYSLKMYKKTLCREHQDKKSRPWKK